MNKVNNHFVTVFDHQPNDLELGVAMGTESITAAEMKWRREEGFVSVEPVPIPVWFVSIGMFCFAVALCTSLGVCYYFGVVEAEVLAIACGASILIVPFFTQIAWWMDKETGTEPYLEFDKSSGNLTLPRIPITFHKDQIEKLVYLERRMEFNWCFQVAFLVHHEDRWYYALVYTLGGRSNDFFGKGFHHQIAEEIGVEIHKIRFTKKESREIENQNRMKDTVNVPSSLIS